MGELRKDYILERYVLISTERGKRPHEFVRSVVKKNEEICFFCPGNEDMTPPEIMRVEKEGNWQVRVFPNKFAAVKNEGNYAIRTDNYFFTFSNNYGYHEVIVESPDHDKQLCDLSPDEISDVLKVYSNRIEDLSHKEGIKYVQIFKNSGKDAGTSLVHTHSQVVAYNVIPTFVKEKVDAVKNYPSCPYCDILSVEKHSLRAVFENNGFVAFTPYASRFPLEVWVFPKRHITRLCELSDEDYNQFADVIKFLLVKLKIINAPYNMILHYSPSSEDLHLHIEILPRLTIQAGFEYGTGSFVNHMSPEDAAKFYKE